MTTERAKQAYKEHNTDVRKISLTLSASTFLNPREVLLDPHFYITHPPGITDLLLGLLGIEVIPRTNLPPGEHLVSTSHLLTHFTLT